MVACRQRRLVAVSFELVQIPSEDIQAKFGEYSVEPIGGAAWGLDTLNNLMSPLATQDYSLSTLCTKLSRVQDQRGVYMLVQ